MLGDTYSTSAVYTGDCCKTRIIFLHLLLPGALLQLHPEEFRSTEYIKLFKQISNINNTQKTGGSAQYSQLVCFKFFKNFFTLTLASENTAAYQIGLFDVKSSVNSMKWRQIGDL